jgi:hypothetical protein
VLSSSDRASEPWHAQSDKANATYNMHLASRVAIGLVWLRSACTFVAILSAQAANSNPLPSRALHASFRMPDRQVAPEARGMQELHRWATAILELCATGARGAELRDQARQKVEHLEKIEATSRTSFALSDKP